MGTVLDPVLALGLKAGEQLAHAHIACRDAAKIAPAAVPWEESLRASGQVTYLRKEELESCVAAMVLCDAMVTGLLHHTLLTHPRFEALKLADIQGQDAQWKAIAATLRWRTLPRPITAWLKFRHTLIEPLLRPAARENSIHARRVRFAVAHAGLKTAWTASMELVHRLHTRPARITWRGFCQRFHLPERLRLSDYPDLDEQAAALIRHHLDGMVA
jgi:hypothetical protein